MPIPEHRAVTLAALSSSTLSPPSHGSPVHLTPIPSPCSSPPPTVPPSGYLEEAKITLAHAVAKRNTKASSLAIDVSANGEIESVVAFSGY